MSSRITIIFISLPNMRILKVWHRISILVSSKHQNYGSMILHSYSFSKFLPSKRSLSRICLKLRIDTRTKSLMFKLCISSLKIRLIRLINCANFKQMKFAYIFEAHQAFKPTKLKQTITRLVRYGMMLKKFKRIEIGLYQLD